MTVDEPAPCGLRAAVIRPAERFAFLLLPRFSLVALGCPLDVLTQADQAQQAAAPADGSGGGGDDRSRAAALLYETRLVSADGRAVPSGSGALLAVDLGLYSLARKEPPLDRLFVVSDALVPQFGTTRRSRRGECLLLVAGSAPDAGAAWAVQASVAARSVSVSPETAAACGLGGRAGRCACCRGASRAEGGSR